MSCGFGGLLHVNMGGAEWVYGPPGGTDGDSCYRPVCEALGHDTDQGYVGVRDPLLAQGSVFWRELGVDKPACGG